MVFFYVCDNYCKINIWFWNEMTYILIFLSLANVLAVTIYLFFIEIQNNSTVITESKI